MIRNADRPHATALKMILLSICVMSLAGCGTLTQSEMPSKPTRPTITIVNEQDGNVCLARDDMSALLSYIIELESGYP